MTALATTATAPDSLLKSIPIEQLQPSPTNPRKVFDAAAMEELKASIVAPSADGKGRVGIQQPLLVRVVPVGRYFAKMSDLPNAHVAYLHHPRGHGAGRNGGSNIVETYSASESGEDNLIAAEAEAKKRNGTGGFEIVAGERRFRAAMELGLPELPCIVRQMTDEQARETQIIENLQRAGIHPLEEAEAFHELLGRLGSIAAVALTVAKEQSYVAKCLRLLALTEDSKRSLLGKLITIEHALLLARLAEREQNAALKWTLDRNAGSKTPVEKVVAERLERVAEERREKSEPGFRYAGWEPESPKQLKAHIESESGIPLSRAPWKLDDAALLPAAGACATCEKNTKANAPLFADLAIGVATCTDGACYGDKTALFVQIKLEAAGQDVDAKPPKLVPRLSWKASTVKPAVVPNDIKLIIETPGRCGETANPARMLRHGQWHEAKKGSCPNVRPGVTADWSDAGDRGYGGSEAKLRKPGETLLVCIAAGCKAHRKDWEEPKSSNGGGQERHDPAAEAKLRAERDLVEKEELKIRGKIFEVILTGLDADVAIRLVADEIYDAPAIRKDLLKRFPKTGGAALEVMTVFLDAFEREGKEVNGYLLMKDAAGVVNDRKDLWALAKKVGVDADAIVAQHFQDAGAIAPGLERLVPKGVKLPDAKKAAAGKKAVPAKVETPAKKGQHSSGTKLAPETRKKIAAQMKKRWAAARKGTAKKKAVKA